MNQRDARRARGSWVSSQRLIHPDAYGMLAPRYQLAFERADRQRKHETMTNRYAALLLLMACCLGCENESRRPDVILITVDTLRADHLGTYGYPQPVSPMIDRFAAAATVYENAISQAPHTLPSLVQIMTSKYRHGLDVPVDEVTLAERLQKAGYQTAAVVDNPLLEISDTARGLMRGFDLFYRNGVLDHDAQQQHWKTKTPADCITAQAVRWLKRRDRERPFFLWLHYFDPHDPYLPPFADDLENLSRHSSSELTGDIRNTPLFHAPGKPGATEVPEVDRQHLVALYDAEVRYVDQSLGELFAFLEDSDLYRPNLIILGADHGESFGEHGLWTHGHSLYAPEVHVPLVIKFPYQAEGERVKMPVQAIDIVPTVLDVLQIPLAETKFDGLKLRQRPPEPAFAFWGPWKLVQDQEWKLLERGETVELFHIGSDRAEEHNRAAEEPAVVDRLRAAAVAKLAGAGVAEKQLKDLSSGAVEQLRALGYLPKSQ